MAEHYAFGLHTVTALLGSAPHRVRALRVVSGRHDQRIRHLLEQAEALGLPVTRVSRKELDHQFPDAAHQGVIAEVTPAPRGSEEALGQFLNRLQAPPFLLLLDQVQDPHNLGACLRTADAAGVSAVIAPKDRSAGLTPAACKVASGSAETVPFFQVTNLARVMGDLKQRNIWLIGTADDAADELYQADLTGAMGLVMGGEKGGLRRLTRNRCDRLVRIPMAGTVASLNVSVATGVCLFEAGRQRRAEAMS